MHLILHKFLCTSAAFPQYLGFVCKHDYDWLRTASICIDLHPSQRFSRSGVQWSPVGPGLVFASQAAPFHLFSISCNEWLPFGSTILKHSDFPSHQKEVSLLGSNTRGFVLFLKEEAGTSFSAALPTSSATFRWGDTATSLTPTDFAGFKYVTGPWWGMRAAT